MVVLLLLLKLVVDVGTDVDPDDECCCCGVGCENRSTREVSLGRRFPPIDDVDDEDDPSKVDWW